MKRFASALLALLVLAPAAAAQPSAQPQYDVLIRNGRVIDGAGNPWFYADVGIVRDRIAFIGRAPEEATARRTVNARGLIVAPGFIDMLGWSEMNVLVDRRAYSKITQGITTEITGEGWSIAPTNDRLIAEQRPLLERRKIEVDWRTLEGYFQRLERQPPTINLATFVGATQLRRMVIGDEDRDPTPDELATMQGLVDYAMRDGALGVSTSLIYAPAFYAKTEELIALAEVAGRHGGMYITHMRNEGDHIRPALDEAFRIGREAGVPGDMAPEGSRQAELGAHGRGAARHRERPRPRPAGGRESVSLCGRSDLAGRHHPASVPRRRRGSHAKAPGGPGAARRHPQAAGIQHPPGL
jgi:N-acyl-D-amino-acid deacylase